MPFFNPTFASIEEDVEYGLGLLSSLGSKVDVVGVYSNGTPGAQQFAKARPLEATIHETSQLMKHPGETGIVLADHHIIDPVRIDLPVQIASKNYAATYAAIRAAYLNATSLSIKTRTGTYKNMVLVDCPHEEKPEMFTAIVMVLRFEQVLYYAPGTTTLAPNFAPVSPLNSNTLSSGLQSLTGLGFTLLAAAGAAASYVQLVKRV